MNDTPYLNRGNLLWESSRMMLPEHKEQLLHYQRNQRHHVRPELDEQHLEQLSEQLQLAIQEQVNVQVICHINHQFIRYQGVIRRLHQHERTCSLQFSDGAIKPIPIDTITHIQLG